MKRTVFWALLVVMLGLALVATGCGEEEKTDIEITSVEDLKELDSSQIATQTGSSGETACEELGLGDVKLYDQYPEAFQDLEIGRVSVVIVDVTTAAHYVGKKPDTYEVVGERLVEEPYAIGLRKEDKELKQEIDAAIREMKEDGTLAEISQEWFGDDVIPEIQETSSAAEDGTENGSETTTWDRIQEEGVLVAGLDDTFAPMGYRDAETNELIGFDIDMGGELSERLGVEIEWHPTDWDGVIPSLKTEKFDCVISGMSVTPEREEEINFSEHYMQAGIAMVVKK